MRRIRLQPPLNAGQTPLRGPRQRTSAFNPRAIRGELSASMGNKSREPSTPAQRGANTGDDLDAEVVSLQPPRDTGRTFAKYSC